MKSITPNVSQNMVSFLIIKLSKIIECTNEGKYIERRKWMVNKIPMLADNAQTQNPER